MEPCRTDKVDHGYLSTYLHLASEIGIGGRVCEIGVQYGYSLELWRVLFPEGLIVGVDHDPGACWPDDTHRVVAEQDDPGLPRRLAEISPEYDLIVDDASHLGGLTGATWKLLWPLVAPGGWYVVEDWQVGFDDWPGFDRSMFELARSFLERLDRPSGDIAQIIYRYGMVIFERRRADAS